ncbi:MAG: CoA transferase [Chloroflexi bacterium]|nr:CoA transferase [Chloroflexota bacterium]
MSGKPLKGIRVVEVTHHVTGPVTTQVLADCGAETIQIETVSRRGLMGGGGGGGGAPGQKAITGRLSVSLNFVSPKGLELAHRLISKADIFVENLAGGTLANRGLGYDDIRKIKPDIIYLATCMQGQTGPHYSHAASGHKLSALAGFNHITGWPDREPGWVGTYTDFVAPRYNIIAIMAALEYRRQTGKGQFLDMSQYEPGLQFMAPAILDYSVNQRVAGRMGNECSYAAPHNAYRCQGEDRWCAISIFTDEEWQSFCRVLGNPALAGDPRFATLLDRKENEEELDRLVNKWTGSRTAEEVMSVMQAAGVAAGLVETVEDQVVHDPQLKARRFFWEMGPPEPGKDPASEQPYYRLSLRVRQGPTLGQHNDYVFKKVLGLSDAEIAELVKERVID